MKSIPWARLVDKYERELRSLFHASQILTREGLMDLATSQRFQKASEAVARRMVAEVDVVNAQNWRQAAFASGRGRKIFEALQHELRQTGLGSKLERISRQNAELIRSIPIDVARAVTAHSTKAFTEGKRPAEVEAEIRRLAPRLTENKIRLIARTEIGKSESALTEARSEEIGSNHYVWQSSEDQRVRPAHQFMNGVIVPWNDKPSPERLTGIRSTLGNYHAGCCPNCRCLSLVLVSLDEVSWPHKVFGGGTVQMMTRAAFRRLAGLPRAA